MKLNVLWRYLFIFLLGIFVSFIYILGFARAQSFEVNPPVFHAVVNEGESVTLSSAILNGNIGQTIYITPSSQYDFIKISDREIRLKAGEDDSISIVLGSHSLIPGVYVGSLTFQGQNKLISPVYLEVQSEKPLFDVLISEPQSSTFSAGDSIKKEVVVYNFRALEPRVKIISVLYDLNGKAVVSGSQFLEVVNNAQFTSALILPENLEDGNYILAISAVKGDSVGTSTAVINIGEREFLSPQARQRPFLIISFVIIFALLVAFLVLSYYWTKKLKSNARYWSQHASEIIKEKRMFKDINSGLQKLNYQRGLLESAYRKEYITKESYELGMSRINSFISQLKKRL